MTDYVELMHELSFAASKVTSGRIPRSF